MRYTPKERTKFEVLGMTKGRLNFTRLSEHAEERTNRIKLIKGYENIVDCFTVDTGHEKGLEAHYIMPNASVVIVNRNSGKLITVLQARPKQIKRYYQATGFRYDNKVLKHAVNNAKTGRNYL